MKHEPPQPTTPRVVVVTGASTGIGKEICKCLTSRGYFVFGSVRKEKDGDDLRQEFGDRFSPLLFDVTNEQQIRDASRQVREALHGRTLFGLVNNAGVAIMGPVLHQDLAKFRQNVDVNLIGVFNVTQAFLPLLGTDRELEGAPGRIVQISSGAGKMSNCFASGYAASKHALEGFSHALRRELLLYGIDVIIIGPGMVRTPILDKFDSEQKLFLETYPQSDYKQPFEAFVKFAAAEARVGDPPEKVARVVLKALTLRRPRTRYAPVHNRLLMWTLPMSLPDRWLDRISGWSFSLLPALPRLAPGGQPRKKQP
eukprot:jgi/Botrbrau1/15147/Bobra.0149s0016.1